MTPSSPKSNIQGLAAPVNADLAELTDKTKNGLSVEAMLKADSALGYLDATIIWMEENSIEPTQFSKYLPMTLIDKIKDEAIKGNMLRPSMSKTKVTNTLDFLL